MRNNTVIEFDRAFESLWLSCMPYTLYYLYECCTCSSRVSRVSLRVKTSSTSWYCTYLFACGVCYKVGK